VTTQSFPRPQAILYPTLLLLAALLLPYATPANSTTSLRVAVLDFASASSDPTLAPLGKGLQSMLITDLSHVGGLTLIERERLTEVVAELDLQQSQYVDPGTATELGKLLGVTHLLTGGYVVDGARMNIDARLVALSGEVLLATSVTGERDAFFELEKELARALASALAQASGGELEPKVRAKLARIHTADYAAFRAFSEGLSAFDSKDYDGAIEKLRAATETDEDFQLARYTLDDYETIISQLRARSNQLELGRRELDRLKKDKDRQDVSGVLSKLWEVAEDTSRQEERLTAIYLLAVSYANIGRNRGKLHKLREVEDTFAMERTADALTRAWFAETSERWPALPRMLSDRFWRKLPEPESFDKDFAWSVDHLWRYGADYPENRRNYLLSDMRYPEHTARRLYLDRREEVALLEELQAQGIELGAEEYWQNEMEEKLVDEYRAVLRLDDSTRLLTRRSRSETHAGSVRAIAEEIERNKELAELLLTSKNKAVMREWLLLGPTLSWSHGPITKFAREQLLGPRPTPEALEQLGRARELDSRGYVLIGGVPMWSHQANWALRTAARDDELRSTGVRYFEAKADAETPALVLYGGDAFGKGTLTATVDFAPADDFWPRGVRADRRPDGLTADDVPAGRPRVGFLVGLTDVNCGKQENPMTEERELVRPTTGWMVQIAGDKLQWIALRESARGSYDRKDAFEERVIAEADLGKSKGALPVTIEVSGATVKVKAGGTRATFKADAPVQGFAGLLLRDQGYVALDPLTLDVDQAR